MKTVKKTKKVSKTKKPKNINNIKDKEIRVNMPKVKNKKPKLSKARQREIDKRLDVLSYEIDCLELELCKLDEKKKKADSLCDTAYEKVVHFKSEIASLPFYKRFSKDSNDLRNLLKLHNDAKDVKYAEALKIEKERTGVQDKILKIYNEKLELYFEYKYGEKYSQ